MKKTNSKALKILFLSNGIYVFAANLLGPLFAVFAQKFDANVLSVSFTWFVYMISATVFTIVVAKFGDRVKEKENMLMLGFVIRSICWILYFFVADTYMLLLVQFLLGIGEAVGTPAFDAIFAEHLNNGKHINAYSNWKIISNLSLAIACLVGGFIVYLVGFKLLFLIMAVLGIASTLIVYFQPRKLL